MWYNNWGTMVAAYILYVLGTCALLKYLGWAFK